MKPMDWERVQELFLQASELPPARRAAFLNKHCEDTAARSEVESLLAAEKASDAWLRSIVTAAALSVQTADSERAIGRRIGPYVVEKEIGQGGMGTVYLAFRDDDEFHQRVAIKVVNRDMHSEFGLTRFRRERQLLADLQHPNIARLLDGGTTSDGLPYFAMEYLEGEAITLYCRRKGLGLRARLELFLPVCSAVQFAHRQLVIHRDLKPGNILVDQDGIPKLLDFGVASLLDEHCEPAGAFSPITAKYASPEQLSGAKLTTATDVYSLGAILRELLEGSGEPVDHDLEAIAAMSMSAEPENRYASPAELAADVRRYLDWQPVRAQTGSFWYRTQKLLRRRRLPVVAAAAVVCSLLLGTAGALHQARQAEAARKVADRERARAEQRLMQMLNLSDRTVMDVIGLMERLPGTMAARRQLAGAMVEFLEKASLSAHSDPAVRVTLAKAYFRLGGVQGGTDMANAGDVSGALKSFLAGSALLEGIPPVLKASPDVFRLWLDLKQNTSRLLSYRHEGAGATALLNETLTLAKAAPPADRTLERSKAGLYLALARANHEDYSKARQYAIEYQHQLESLLLRFPGDPDLRYDLSVAHTEIGFDFIKQGNPEEAVDHYRKSMQIREELAKEHPTDGIYRRVLMLSYMHFAGLQGSPLVPNLGQTAVARQYYKKALPLVQELSEDPDNSLAAGDYASFLMRSAALDVEPGGLAESLATLRRSVMLFQPLQTSGGRDVFQPLEATAHLYIGHRLLTMGKRSEAMQEYQKAATLTETFLSAHPLEWDVFQDRLEAENGIVQVQILLKNRNAAVEHASRMVQQAGQSAQHAGGGMFGEMAKAKAYLGVAQAHQAFNESAPAREAARHALEHATPWLTGRTWDPMVRVVRDARAIESEK